MKKAIRWSLITASIIGLLIMLLYAIMLSVKENERAQAKNISEAHAADSQATVQSSMNFVEWKRVHAPLSTHTCYIGRRYVSCTLSGGSLSAPVQVSCNIMGCSLSNK